MPAGSWQHPAPCSSSVEGPGPSLTVTQGPQVPGPPAFLLKLPPLHRRGSQWWVWRFSSFTFSAASLLPSSSIFLTPAREGFLLFSVVWSGCALPGNPGWYPCPKACNLNYIYRAPFAFTGSGLWGTDIFARGVCVSCLAYHVPDIQPVVPNWFILFLSIKKSSLSHVEFFHSIYLFLGILFCSAALTLVSSFKN